MPHQCVRCNKFHEDGSEQILKGCSCGGKLFFFVKKSKMKKAMEAAAGLSEKEKQQVEEDVFALVGQDSSQETVILDFESINVSSPGKYELDLVSLFKGEPLVYKFGEGRYMIDVEKSFSSVGKKKA